MTDEGNNVKTSPERAQLEAGLDRFESVYREGNTMALVFCVVISQLLQKPVPKWAHDGLAEAFTHYLASECELDLNQLVGNKRGEGKPSELTMMKRESVHLRLAIRLGNELKANDALPPRRRRTTPKAAVYRRVGCEFGLEQSTLETLWSSKLKKIYKAWSEAAP